MDEDSSRWQVVINDVTDSWEIPGLVRYDQQIQAIHPEILNHSPRFLMFQFNPFSQNPQNRIKTLNWGSWGFVKEVEAGTRTSKRDFLQGFLVRFKMHNESCNNSLFLLTNTRIPMSLATWSSGNNAKHLDCPTNDCVWTTIWRLPCLKLTEPLKMVLRRIIAQLSVAKGLQQLDFAKCKLNGVYLEFYAKSNFQVQNHRIKHLKMSSKNRCP